MKISPEQSMAKASYPMRGKALAALAATAVALISCDRHVPGSVPMQAKSSDPTDHSAVPATPPDEEPEKLGGVVAPPDEEPEKLSGVVAPPDEEPIKLGGDVPYMPEDMPEDKPEPVAPPDEEPIKLGGDVPYMPEPAESQEN